MPNSNISEVKVNGKFMEFPSDIDPEQARAVFERRFGYAPEKSEVIGWRLLVGPVNDDYPGWLLIGEYP